MKLSVRYNSALRRDRSPGDRRFWFLWSVGLRIKIQAIPIWEIEVYWKRLLVGGAVAAVIGYLGLVTGVHRWWSRSPHNQVRWVDLALAPVDWAGLRAKRGDTAVAQALERLKAKDYVEAFYGLRVGLSRSPGNVQGRVMLARLMASSDPAGALKLLEDGLAFTPGDTDLVRALFSYYAVQQSPGRALSQAEALLARTELAPEASHLLKGYRVSLLLDLGRAPEAEAALAAMPEGVGRKADLRRFQLLEFRRRLKTGALEEARAYFDQHLNDGTPEGLRAEGELALAVKDEAAFLSATRRLRAALPDQPMPFLFAYQGWHVLKRPSQRDMVESEYYQMFGGSDSALQSFAAVLVNLDQPDAIRRAAQVARENRLSNFAFKVHLTEVALRRGDVDQALRELREWENSVDTLNPGQRFYPEFVKRLTRASLAAAEQAGVHLQEHLMAGRGQGQPAIYSLAVDVLERTGNPGAALATARQGLKFYVNCDSLRAAEQRLSTIVVQAESALSRQEAAAEAPILPATAAGLLQAVDESLAADTPSQARSLLQAVRRSRPAWLESNESAVALRETELVLFTQDALTARAALRGYLDRHRTAQDALRAVPVVGRLIARNRLAEARLARDEIAASSAVNTEIRLKLAALNLPDETTSQVQTAAGALAALDQCISAGQWADAERLLTALRDHPPVWLAEGRTELAVREVSIRLALGQRPQALTAFKDLVVRAGAPRSAAFKLVRDTFSRDEHEHALLLAKEVARLIPDDVAAAKLLKEVQTPRPPGEP